VIIVAVVYFFVVLPINKLMDRFKAESPVGKSERECPYCLSKIPQAATHCAFCTQQVRAADPVPAKVGL
jgi:large conductance mechanosensitive channel